LSLWIVAGFAYCLLLFPPWDVNVEYATFIGVVMTIQTRYIITSIMWGFLGQSGHREKDNE
jgi:hypothetical protein